MAELQLSGAQRVGGGRFADVYRAEYGGQVVALKVATSEPRSVQGYTNEIFFVEGLRFHTGSVGPDRVDPQEILRLEVQTLRKADHPLVVPVLAEGTYEGRAAYLMPWLDGEEAGPAIYDGRLGEAEFLQLLDALTELEARWGQHGDIKPANILFDKQAGLRLVDPSSGYTMHNPVGQPERMLTTSWYNPGLDTSDLPALALTWGEILFQEHLWLAAESPIPPTLSEKLQADLRARNAVGLGALWSRVAGLKLPTELGATKGQQDVLLKALGLRFDGVLDLESAFASVADFAAAVRATM